MKTTKTTRLALALLLAGGASASQAADSLTQAKMAYFESKVRPVFARNCYRCHSEREGSAKGGFTMDTRAGMLKGGDSGPVVVPGRPEQSLLVKAIQYYDGDLQMPPDNKKLLDGEINALTQWVLMGAPYPEGTASVVSSALSYDQSVLGHWAFQPVKSPQPPSVVHADWVNTPVDQFIVARIEQKGMKPNQLADKPTVLRRLYFDLIGLPPTPEEMVAFVKDESPNAYEKVVDRLLRSNHFGERWGRHWLDVARYADTKGDANRNSVYIYPYAYSYRDYVIDALNENKPFDQFVKEQIAADYMVAKGEAKSESLAGLGFLTLGNRFDNNMEEIYNDRIDTVTKGFQSLTVSCSRCHDHKFDPIPTADYYSLRGIFASCDEPDEFTQYPMMGKPDENSKLYKSYQTELGKRQDALQKFYEKDVNDWLAKAREHPEVFMLAYVQSNRGRDRQVFYDFVRDNRFQNYKNGNDVRYYSQHWIQILNAGRDRRSALQSIFAPFHRFNDLDPREFRTKGADIIRDIQRSNAINARIKRAFKGVPYNMEQVVGVYTELFRDASEAYEDKQKNPNKLIDPNRQAFLGVAYMVDRDADPNKSPFERLRSGRILPRNLESGEVRLKTDIAQLENSHPGAPARAMVLLDKPQPVNSPIFIRGEARSRGEVVPRRFLAITEGKSRQTYPPNQSGRYQLAEDLASKDNPLTARVFVNRVWLHLFGEGIVTTPDDFGVQSDPPSHPELIDYLSAQFMNKGWNVKWLIKEVVMSSVYRQTSETNQRFAQIDPNNRLLWRQNIRRLEFEPLRDSLLAIGGTLDKSIGGKPFNLQDENSRRRTVYAKIDRGNLPEVFNHFDFANPDMTSGKRYDTTVPQQALFMMNSPLVVELAKNLVRRKDFEALDTPEARINLLHELIFQRPADNKDHELGMAFIRDAAESTGADVVKVAFKKGDKNSQRAPLGAWEQYAHALLQTNEASFIN